MSQTSADTQCPGAPDWRRLIRQEVSSEERQRLQTHLDACPACQAALQALRSDTVAESEANPATNLTLDPGGLSTRMPSRDLRDFARRFPFLSPPLEPGEIGWLGKYRILGVLGEGGMGVVFEAEEIHLQRRVALKVMKPEIAANSSARLRFLQEARAAAALPQDHVVTIYAVDQENDVPYLAMQLLNGESLERRLQREGRLPPEEVVRIARQVAAGLAVAHDKGLIHRDIKPANLWLESPPHPSRVKILDFGLARSLTGECHLTASGIVVGTPHYLAPEQARGDPKLDGRCDLFSLGVVMYRMLSGTLPFDGPNPLALMTALAVDDPEPLSRIAPSVPRPLMALTHRLLLKDPAQRPANAQAVLAELDALSGTSPPTATQAPVPTAAGPTATRHSRWPLRSVLLSLAAFVLVNALLIWSHFANKPSGDSANPQAAPSGEPIKLGVLFSLSGRQRDNGKAAAEAAQLAVDDLNAQGGVLGRPVKAVLADGSSDPAEFNVQAEKLITKEEVCAVVGCWTSASRRTVVPLFEKHNHLLLYPVQYEGLEDSPAVFYLGAAPNQQVLPAVHYAVRMLRRRRFFLVGVDTVYSRAVIAIIKDALNAEPEKPQVVGENYLAPSVLDISGIVAAVVEHQPDFIINMLNIDTDMALVEQLRVKGIDSVRTPTLSFDIPESELMGLGARRRVGDYVACNYFQSIKNPVNEAFVKGFKERYGEFRSLSDPMENTYVGVQLWARAVEAAGDTSPPKVRKALEGLAIDAPAGFIRIDPATHNTWNVVRLARIQEGGKTKVVFSTEDALAPEPFPASRTRAQWEKFLQDLYQSWDGHWEAPSPR
jgi:urea transport system substrate-binding protein